jgi:hypothetical protein
MAKRKSRKTTDEHYVDNKKFLLAMQDWKKDCSIASNLNKPVPPVSDYIGECFMKIANHLSYRPNFINYTYRDEMIADGIENCIQYSYNFNPEKSNNPFAYFTQIIYYAFVRRIQKEKKQSHIKNKMMERDVFETFTTQKGDATEYHSPAFDEFKNMMLPEEDVYKPKNKKKSLKKKGITLGLEIFMGGNDKE